MNNLKSYLLTKFFIIVISLITIELLLQIFYRMTNGDFLLNRVNLPLYENSNASCWKLKSNLKTIHKTNEFGYEIIVDDDSFRCLDVTENKDVINSKEKKVMFLGAGTAFGWGNSYNDTYAYLISKYLKTKGIKESINAATPAQLPNRQLCWFIKEGYKYKPDIIIHTLSGEDLDLFLPQDIDDFEKFCEKISQCKIHGYTVNKNGYLVSDENSLMNYKLFFKNSATFFYIWYNYSKVKSNFIKEEKILKTSKNISYKNKNFLLMYKNYLKVINKYSKNTKVIFLHIPKSYAIHFGDRSRWSHQKIDFKKILIENTLNIKKIENKYNFIDMYPLFSKERKFKRIYYFLDANLNSYGHKLTFKVFKDYCEKNKCYNVQK
jgi:hypothetical protein